MSDTMLERVGKAIAEHLHRDGDFGLDGATAFQERRGEFDGMARAAIEAMRAPTVDMCIAGAKAGRVRPYEADDVFEAMISAALPQDTHSLPSEDR